MHDPVELEQLLNTRFLGAYKTRLKGGGEEPLYVPPGVKAPEAVIVYRADYFASALHELAHWCIAGEERRQLVDYGYWYQASRSPAEQQAFHVVESRPQALEWIFSTACGYRFRPSYDNLTLTEPPLKFTAQILIAVRQWLDKGLPPRAGALAGHLADHYGGRHFADLSVYENKR